MRTRYGAAVNSARFENDISAGLKAMLNANVSLRFNFDGELPAKTGASGEPHGSGSISERERPALGRGTQCGAERHPTRPAIIGPVDDGA